MREEYRSDSGGKQIKLGLYMKAVQIISDPCQPTLHVAVAEIGETLYCADLDAIKKGKYKREIIK